VGEKNVRTERIKKPLVRSGGITVRDLFNGRIYRLDSFQRSYAWEKPQIEKLVNDLAEKFQRQWDPTDNYDDVDAYDPYFLGSVITYRIDGQIYLADGQQRVISLLLLLIQLYRAAQRRDDTADLGAGLRMLIRGGQSREGIFAVYVESYEPCFTALLNGREFSIDAGAPDLRRVWNASEYVLDAFPPVIIDRALPDFIHWLLHRVCLVEMEAADRTEGNEMFSTINDRGVRLTPLDHLKNYLFTDARDDQDKLDHRWRSMVTVLEAVDRNGPLEFVRAVLHARYFDLDRSAESARALEETPHEWLLTHEKALWPGQKKGAPATLFTEWLDPLHGPYTDLLRAAGEYREGLEAIWFNARNGVTRQFDLTLAAARPEDSDSTFRAKARLVARFVDLFVVSRGLSGRPYGGPELAEETGPLLPQVRESRTLESLSRVLGAAAAGWYDSFGDIPVLQYREGANRHFVLYFLARLTAWLDKGAERHERADRLLRLREDGRRPYEIEHLFTKKSGVYDSGILTEEEFRQIRGKLGGLVLLDGEENASLGGKPLAEKLVDYARFNWLAASISPGSYGKGRANVKFRRFIQAEQLQDLFTPYQAGSPVGAYIDSRAKLYRTMAEHIWRPEELGLTVPGGFSGLDDAKPVERVEKGKTRTKHPTSIADLLNAGVLVPDEGLVGRRGGTEFKATILASGRIRTSSGVFGSPTGAAKAVRNAQSENGWTFWTVTRKNQTLDTLRQRYQAPS
jgi:hypothetical protein